MRRLLPFAAVLLALSGVAHAGAPTNTGLSATRRAPVLATTSGQSPPRLFFADPVSLRPVDGRSLRLDFNWGGFARSPNGSQLAISRNSRPEVRFVRLGNLQFAGRVRLMDATLASPLAWLSPRLLLVLANWSPMQVLAIDPTLRKVLWRRSIEGELRKFERMRDGLVAVVAATDTIAPARLVAIGSDGSVRSVVLERVLAGFERHDTPEDFVGTTRSPGLAADAVGNRAFVVGAGEPIAEVELSTMTVTYHGGARTLAKAIQGSDRWAAWLGNGMLAVAGSDFSVERDAQGRVARQTVTPSGLVLVDTGTWAARMLQADAATAMVVGHSLLAYGSRYDSATRAVTGSGFTVYNLAGAPRLHILGQAQVNDVRAHGGLAYVFLRDNDGHVLVIDADAGRILARVVRPEIELLPRT